MKNLSDYVCLFIAPIWVICFFFGSIQQITAEPSEPLPPPINIEFTIENTPRIDTEIALKIKVTPLEDMHLEIICFLPEGVEPIKEEGIIIRPYEDRYGVNGRTQMDYPAGVELWLGQLKAQITKEFIFRVRIHERKRYEFIVRAEALAKWGVKEEVLVVDF